MPIPSYLKGYASDITESEDHVHFILKDSQGGQNFRIFAYAELCRQMGLYTDTKEGRSLFVAQSVRTKERITLFDNCIHGFNNMFVNSFLPEPRLVSELPFSPRRIMVQLCYEIPYDEQKGMFRFDSSGNCILTGGRTMPWEQVKTDGYDWITLCYEGDDDMWAGFLDEDLGIDDEDPMD